MTCATRASRRLQWIEAARTVAMTVVVWSHASNTAFFREGDFSVTPLFSACLVTFAVPAFFCISGYLLGRNDLARPPEVPFSRRPARQAARLLPPFLAWNALTLVCLKGLYGVPLLRLDHLADLFTGSMQLYFVFALLQFLALLTLVNPFATPGRLNRWTLAAAGSTAVFYGFSQLLFHLSPPADFRFELVGIRLAPAWAWFFFLGAWLSRHEGLLEALTRRLPLVGAAAVLTFAAYLWDVCAEAGRLGANYRQYFLLSGLAFQTAGALALCCACRRLEARGGGRLFDLLAATGRDTLGIYLSHYVLILAFYAVFAPPVAPAWRLPLGLAAMAFSLGGGLFLTRLARRFPDSRLAGLLFPG
ncbi:MAG: acyltransferase family protein [Solidesulfovibrio sp. DCME]|uniref:acyltransferase family protein n=1 Tax=Solidesulfovibrio sp. DCME TaxID=3447380 RepID=UPI003D0C0FD6